jgi:molecular chaperone DnaK (HSP70)
VDPFGESIQGVKLLLDETQCIPYGPSIDSAQIIKQMHKDAVTVSGEYLRKLTTHGKEVLRRRFGDAFETMNLQYILTVPAVWSDKAKDATRRAAHLAGIPLSDLILVSEPEAAAMCAIRTIQPNTIKVFVCDTHNGIIEEAYQMQVDDCLVVCDAGGGTVVNCQTPSISREK